MGKHSKIVVSFSMLLHEPYGPIFMVMPRHGPFLTFAFPGDCSMLWGMVCSHLHLLDVGIHLLSSVLHF